jgi:protein-disulfide isomerase
MKKIFACVGVAIMLAAVLSCTKKDTAGSLPSTATGPGGVVAKIGDEEISSTQLDEAAKAQLKGLEMKVYQIKKQVLDGLIDEKLVTAAAKKEGKSLEDYAKAMIDDKVVPPTDAEVKKVYEERKGADAPAFDEVKKQIAEYLVQAQRKRFQQELITKLRAEAKVKVLLDPPRVEVSMGDSPAMGPKDAKVTLVEFSDYQCPFCGREREVIWQIVDKYKDKVRYVFKDFPLSFHRDAQKSAEAAHCAGDQGKYWEYNKKAFESQNALGVDDLKKYAKELGLDTAKFDKCLDSGAYEAGVKKSLEEGAMAGVSGTPAYFINGIMLSGAQPPEAFVEIIEAELQK